MTTSVDLGECLNEYDATLLCDTVGSKDYDIWRHPFSDLKLVWDFLSDCLEASNDSPITYAAYLTFRELHWTNMHNAFPLASVFSAREPPAYQKVSPVVSQAQAEAQQSFMNTVTTGSYHYHAPRDLMDELTVLADFSHHSS